MGITKNPVKLLIGAISGVLTLSAILRMSNKSISTTSYAAGQFMTMYEWAADNCKQLNITEIDMNDIENWEPACYVFGGHIRVEGNITVPPLPETTQCDSLLAQVYLSGYNKYLAHQCNFNGMHEECADYNPACKRDNSVEGGLGHEVRYGWIPSIDSYAERYHSLIAEAEYEDWKAQSDDWKTAAVTNFISTFQMNQEHCLKLGDNDQPICSWDQFGSKEVWRLNHTDIVGWIDDLYGGIVYEMGGYFLVQDAENVAIYDIGKDSAGNDNKIHLNFKGWEEELTAHIKELKQELEAEYPDRDWTQTTTTPMAIPAETRPEYRRFHKMRHLDLVMKERLGIYYSSHMMGLISKLSAITQSYEMTQLSGEERFVSPEIHPLGDITTAPMAIPDLFYSDAELEAVRLNGSIGRASPGPLPWLGKTHAIHPFAMSDEVFKKFAANGGEMTDAEFKALPEYGDPEHFPLIANETRWPGSTNCMSDDSDLYTPKHAIGTRKFTPVCRMPEPTDYPLEFLGMVHKKTNKNTGEPMLVWNPISLSKNEWFGKTYDSSMIPSSKLWDLPHTMPEFWSREGTFYPDFLAFTGLLDWMVNPGGWYGIEWFYNGLFKNGRQLLYYITWMYPTDPILWDIVKFDSASPLFPEVSKRAVYARDSFNSSWYGLYSMCIGFFGIIALCMFWQKQEKRDSEQSN